MRMRCIVYFCVLAVLGLSLAAQPTISFETDAIRVSGLTVRGDLVYAGAARPASGYTRAVATETGRLPDHDQDAVVSIPLEQPLPLHSLWIAVDLSSGRSVVTFPHAPNTFHRVEKLTMGELREVGRDSLYVLFLLVRPGVGAWTLVIEDTDRHDADRQADSKVRLRVADMQPIGSSPAAPRHLEKQDVVFAVDPLDLRVYEFRDEAVQ